MAVAPKKGKTSLNGTQKKPAVIHAKGRITENENQEEMGLDRKVARDSSMLEATSTSGGVTPYVHFKT